MLQFLFAFLLRGPKSGENSGQAHVPTLKGGLTAAFLIALVEAVREAVALPPSWHALPVRAHEVPRNVALRGDVIAWQQLAL